MKGVGSSSGPAASVLLQEMLHGSSGKVFATPATGQGLVTLLPHLWGSWLADYRGVLLLAEAEVSAHPQSMRDVSQDGRSHRTIIPVSDYINNLQVGLVWGAELSFIACSQKALWVITKSDTRFVPGSAVEQFLTRLQGVEYLWVPLSRPCASLGRLLHPGTHWLQMAKALFLKCLLVSYSWSESELGNMEQRTSPAAD